MIHRILVALDGSHLAEHALAHACRLARQTGAVLVLVRAAPFTTISENLASPASGTVREAERYLDAVRERLTKEGYSVRTAVAHGDAAPIIVAEARAQRADLVVMGTHGRSGLRQVVLGSVAQEVLQRISIPLFLVRANEPPIAVGSGPYQTILAPLNGAAYAEAALSYLAREELAREAGLVLLRAVPPPIEPGSAGLLGYFPEAVLEREDWRVQGERLAARRYLDALARTRPHGRTPRILVAVDDPARAILETAAREEVELIVMVLHGRAGFDRLVHGSVARHVLHHTPVPLLFLHQVSDDTSIPGADAPLADKE